jgi:CBS-domain-containing membrane protein
MIDPKVKSSLGSYIFQSLLATVAILLVLIFLDILEHTAIIATLGASSFIVFIMPNSYISLPKQVLGGYLLGILCGCLCFFLMSAFGHLLSMVPMKVFVVALGALAVGGAAFLMSVLNIEHPPAVGVALGLVLNQWNHQTVVFIIIAIIVMLVVKRLLQPILIDLM